MAKGCGGVPLRGSGVGRRRGPRQEGRWMAGGWIARSEFRAQALRVRTDFVKAWPAFGLSPSDVPLREAHARFVNHAEGLLPFHVEASGSCSATNSSAKRTLIRTTSPTKNWWPICPDGMQGSRGTRHLVQRGTGMGAPHAGLRGGCRRQPHRAQPVGRPELRRHRTNGHDTPEGFSTIGRSESTPRLNRTAIRVRVSGTPIA